MLLSFINLLLTPYCLVFFFFFASSNSSLYFESKGTNTQKLKIVPYTIYSLVFALTILFVTYAIGFFLPDGLNVWEVYQPRYYWLSILSWLVTGFTLSVYFKGMEGNIMGFIFFPLLFVSSMVLLIVNASAIFTFFVTINAPTLKLNFWLRLLLHAFLPFYILLFINEQNKNEKTNNSKIEPIIGSLIFQVIFFGINWLAVKLFGNALTFSQFFGEDQTIIYYLPMIGGLLYYILYILSKKNILPKNQLMKRVNYFALLITSLLILLQLMNYIRLIWQHF